MSSPGSTGANPTPPPGLINAAPGATSTTPGANLVAQNSAGTGTGTGQNALTGTSASSTTPSVTTYNPNSFSVPDNAKVASQLGDIIASGSPLMQQAEASARATMNSRGLINSSIGITAGQDAVIKNALPIAQQDAQTQAAAATNTTNAQNTALAANAAAANTAANTGANIQSTQNIAAANIQSAQDIATLQANTQKSIADLQANTSLTLQDKQAQLSTLLANIQSNTSLTIQDKQSATQMALQAAQSTLQTQLANIQANTSLSIADKQTQSQQLIAQWNNQNAQVVQQMQNEGNLANIQANGQINKQITDITNANKTLLQTSSGAAQIYNQALTNLSSIIQNTNMTPDQKTTALNDQVQQLNDALSVISQIAGIPDLSSTLTFANDNSTQAQSSTGVPTATNNGSGGLINNYAA